MNADLEDTGPVTIPGNFPAIQAKARPSGQAPPPRHATPVSRHRKILLKFFGGVAAAVLAAGTAMAFIQAGPLAITKTLAQSPAVLLPVAEAPAHRPYIPAVPPVASPATFMHPRDVSVPVPARKQKHLRHIAPVPVTVAQPQPAPHHTTQPAPEPSPSSSESSPSPAPSPTPTPTSSPSPSPSPSGTVAVS
jgi:hypothetical protein